MKETNNGSQQPADILTPEAIAERALAATVYLEISSKDSSMKTVGSGFFVGEDLIAAHRDLVLEATEITAKHPDRLTSYEVEGVASWSPPNETVLLKVDRTDIKPLRIGDSEAVESGDQVYVAGDPEGGDFVENSIAGRVDKGVLAHFQLTDPIPALRCGLPVLNEQGEVIGMTYTEHTDGHPLNFAIPSKYIRNLPKLPRPMKSLPQVSGAIYAARGLDQVLEENYEAAISYLTKSIQMDPNPPKTYRSRADAYMKLERFEAAIVDYTKALEVEPTTFMYYERGRAKMHLGRSEEALADARAALEIEEDYHGYFLCGLVNMDLGRRAEAIDDFTQTIRLSPGHRDAHHRRGMARELLGQHEGAIADFTEVIANDPADGKPYQLRGMSKMGLHLYPSAVEDFTEAVRLNPKNDTAYVLRGRSNMNQLLHASAIEDFTQAIKINPNSAEAYQGRGAIKTQLGRTTSAIEDLTQAIALDTNPRTCGEAYFHLGLAKISLGRDAEAVEDLTQAITLVPNHPTAHQARALANMDLKRYEAVIADTTHAIEGSNYPAHLHAMSGMPKNEHDAKLYYLRGVSKTNLNRIEEAVEDLERAIVLNPGDANTHYRLGVARLQLGRHEDALGDFSTAIRLDPNRGVLYYSRGCAKMILERPDTAKRDFETALRIAVETGDATLGEQSAAALRQIQ